MDPPPLWRFLLGALCMAGGVGAPLYIVFTRFVRNPASRDRLPHA